MRWCRRLPPQPLRCASSDLIAGRDGVVVVHWKPTGEAPVELSPILKPLDDFRDQMVVVSGLSHKQAGRWATATETTPRHATWLNSVHPKWTEGAEVRAGTTADQIAARELRKDTPLPSIELGLDQNFVVGNCENGYSCIYMNTLAWRTPHPLPAEINPRAVFERLFGEGGTPAERLAQMRRTRSVLDAVTEQMRTLQRTVGPGDRHTVTDYLDGVREIERRIQRAEADGGGTRQPTLERPMGIPDRFDEHANLMFDLQCLAFQADVTRVFTFMLGRETSSRSFPEIGLSAPHHGQSHHGNKTEEIQKCEDQYLLHGAVRIVCQKAPSIPDGDGTLLDHMLLLYGAGE
jgi:hypothetical protein